jgi:hypothetical protein
MATRSEQARAVLRANDRVGHCVPTARLYFFQWNWDPAFVAMGWHTPSTSGITQPLLLATAVMRLWHGAKDRAAADEAT